ncbi:MAG: hypothetical protein Q9208_000600 [Pyrenodesmia sp. 3 TL-2023]
MSTPCTAEEVFDAIDHDMDRLSIYYRSMPELSAYIDQRLEEARNRYPFMRSKTHMDYSIYQSLRLQAKLNGKETAPYGPAKTSKPKSVEEVFEQIGNLAKELDVYGKGLEKYQNFIVQQLDAAKAKYPFMKDATRKDYALNRGLLLGERYGTDSPETAEEVFDAIQQYTYNTGVADGDYDEFNSWLDKTLDQARQIYPAMKDKTVLDYLTHNYTRRYEKIKASMTGPAPTSGDYWNACYTYNPAEPETPASSMMYKIRASGRLGPVTIGKVYGRTLLRLEAGLGSLPPQKLPFEPRFGYAASRTEAIGYPDGHPSKLAAVSESSAATGPVIKSSDDHILRRCTSLGWVTMETSPGCWRNTGHILVMDMDDNANRNRHPWLVLASEWPTHSNDIQDDDWDTYAEEEVIRDDSSEYGVFPCDNNRTPICSIRPMAAGSEASDKPILQQFGEHFNFEPVRTKGVYPAVIGEDGPGLARVMDWYWDPEAGQEVCYYKDGQEYMRYDPKKGEYSYPHLDILSFVGEQSMFGELQEEEDRLRKRDLGTETSAMKSSPALMQGQEHCSVGF